MVRSKTNPKAGKYFERAKKWRAEMERLRSILMACPLDEEFKWDKPCYTFEGANIVLVMGFKEHCVLLFCKGALLKDPKHILIKPGEQTQAARQARFTSVAQIEGLAGALKSYVNEAIAVEKAGLEITYKKITEYEIPAELQEQFVESPALKTAFRALTPGRQRAYIIYFSGAKQSNTRVARIEKYAPQILEGRGMND
ncbi:MAG TPA: YdeI/OmpD-associated family protein [Chthoniobacteraceae bacterium]|nr:YdeI/OmpD-associated family protein [Chthoniobacteraceae bacterium]